MSILRAIAGAIGSLGHWVQEAYCTVGQKVGERLEDASDAIAQRRYEASTSAGTKGGSSASPAPVVEVTGFRVINGHKHAT